MVRVLKFLKTTTTSEDFTKAKRTVRVFTNGTPARSTTVNGKTALKMAMEFGKAKVATPTLANG